MQLLKDYPNACKFTEQDIQFICDMLHLILSHNYVQFGSQIYHQNHGTAMGTPAAVIYADFVLAILEIPVTSLPGILLYQRFIDDIFVISQPNCPVITTFNAQNEHIQIVASTNGNSGVFLDITISIDNTDENNPKIVTTLFQKPSNKYLYITPHSAHGKAQVNNLIFTELNRYRLRCSKDTDYEDKTLALNNRLLRRGYNYEQLQQQFMYKPSRDQLLAQLQTRLGKTDNNNKDSNNSSDMSPLVIITKSPDPRIRIPWQNILQFPATLADNAKFKLCILPRKVIIGRKHYNAAAFYLSKHKNLLPKINTATSSK